jgi:hypothetical protein
MIILSSRFLPGPPGRFFPAGKDHPPRHPFDEDAFRASRVLVLHQGSPRLRRDPRGTCSTALS